jgi:hypothetical protein
MATGEWGTTGNDVRHARTNIQTQL